MKKPKTLVTTKITGIKLSPNLSGKKLTCSMIDWKYSSLSKSQQKQITIRGKIIQFQKRKNYNNSKIECVSF